MGYGGVKSGMSKLQNPSCNTPFYENCKWGKDGDALM